MNSLMLYHHPLSVCSMKVRLALEEKALPWSGRVIDIVHKQEQLEPWYIKLNPKGVIPTLEYRSGTTQVITDSIEIIQFIANLPEGNPLLPESERDLQQVKQLLELAGPIDLQLLSYARHPSHEKSEKILNTRISKANFMAKQRPDLKDSYLECAVRSETNRELRVEPSQVQKVEDAALAAISILENQLQDKAFLLADDYSLADVLWTVVISRLDLLGYDSLVKSDQFPAVADYYLRMQKRPSYQLAQVQNQWWEK